MQNMYGAMANRRELHTQKKHSPIHRAIFLPPKIGFYEIFKFFAMCSHWNKDESTNNSTPKKTKSGKRFISILSLWLLPNRTVTVNHLNDIEHFVHVRRLLVSKSFSFSQFLTSQRKITPITLYSIVCNKFKMISRSFSTWKPSLHRRQCCTD